MLLRHVSFQRSTNWPGVCRSQSSVGCFLVFFFLYNIVLMFTPSCHVVSSVSLMLSPTADLMSFDELSYTSEKLSHPTANRPKMPGRRLPAQFGGTQSVSKLFFFFFFPQMNLNLPHQVYRSTVKRKICFWKPVPRED